MKSKKSNLSSLYEVIKSCTKKIDSKYNELEGAIEDVSIILDSLNEISADLDDVYFLIREFSKKHIKDK